MVRKTTTKAFRERALSMVLAGITTERVAEELCVEHRKIRRRFYNSISNSASANPGIFDIPVPKKDAGDSRPVIDKEKRKLEMENKQLGELVHLSTQWISVYIVMQAENHAGY